MISRRALLSAAACTSLSAFIPNQVYASGREFLYSFDIVDEWTIRIIAPDGVWIAESYEDGALYVTDLTSPDGALETITYDRVEGFVSMASTGASTYIGPDEEYLKKLNTPSLYIPTPTIVNGPTVRKTKRISYAQVKQQAGGAKDITSIAQAIIRLCGFGGSMLGVLVSVLNKGASFIDKVMSGDPNHGFVVTYNETVRYQVHDITGAKRYYDTQYGLIGIGTY